MNKIVSLIVACFFISCGSNETHMTSNNTSEATSDDGWTVLFDGKTIKGWHSYGKDHVGAAWKVEAGVLHLDGASKKNQKAEGGDMVTNDEYEDFDLKLEWKISPKGNSGIIFYVHEDASKYDETWNTGPEIQVLDNGSPTEPGHSDGKIYTHRAGDLYDLLASKEVAKPAGEWNEAEIVCNKGKLELFLNGEKTLSTTLWNDAWKKMIGNSKFKDMKEFGSFKKGRIALQDHGDDVWFRNIRIKKL